MPPKPVTSSATKSNQSVVHNKILLAMSPKECTRLFEHLEFIQTPTHTVLTEAEQPIAFAYFINAGLSSILNVLENGKSVEVGLNGVEGFVGVPLLAGFKTSPSRVIMQVGGSVFRIPAKEFTLALRDCPELFRELNRYFQTMTLQAQQVAACNRLHDIEERLARWLLMCQDRIGGDVVPLTQDFLAYMLASRRASVTVAAGILQKAGLITYRRGVVKIENRQMLEDASCECYAFLVRQGKQWQAEITADGTNARN